jgi:hypothetical protein
MVDDAIGGSHGLPEAGPMALGVVGRDDEVERLADRLGGPVPEQGLGRGIPDTDDAGGLCEGKCGCGLCHVTNSC